VNLSDIARLGEKNVTVEIFHSSGLVRRKNALVKVLGDGELKGAVTVQAHKFSKSAQEKITKAGGKFEALGAVEESKPETKAESGKPSKPEAKQSKPKAE
jgi:large subunit ribosomal protein L15